MDRAVVIHFGVGRCGSLVGVARPPCRAHHHIEVEAARLLGCFHRLIWIAEVAVRVRLPCYLHRSTWVAVRSTGFRSRWALAVARLTG